MNKILLLLAFLLLGAPVCAAPPDDALKQIGIAIDNGDTAAFEELVDMDAILNEGMDLFLKEARNTPSQLSPMLAMLFSQQGGQAIRNLLNQEAKAFVLNSIATGAFAGKQLNSARPQGIFAPLFADASMGRKEIRGIGEPVAADNGWYMPFSVHDYGNGNDYAIIGRFENINGKTRLVAIENLDQIFNQIKKEAGAE